MSDLFFLDVDDLIEIHDSILEQGMGLAGVHIEKLAAIAGRVKNQYVYGKIHNAFELAAHYGEALARGHAFVDANKRTAFVTMLSTLHNNGYPIPNDQAIIDYYNSATFIADLMVNVATGKTTSQQLADIIAMSYLAGSEFDGELLVISEIASIFKK